MILLELECSQCVTHSRPHKQPKQYGRPAIPAVPATLNDFQVLTFRQWCDLNGISARTGRRILASGTGPAVTRLSAKRMGISVGAHRAWLASRERAS